AGNEADVHWSGTFADTDGDDLHNFTTASDANRVSVAAGTEICAFLKWDDWPAATQDYDLYLFRLSPLTLVAGSASAQTGSQPPVEGLCFRNTGASGTFAAAIARDGTTQTPRLDLFTTTGPLEHAIAAGSLLEPATSPNALAVGAMCWEADTLEPFSSRGPTIDGRTKPDVAGQDAVSSWTYGGFAGCSARGGFFGTSAAAPHVAGAAALIKQANPFFGPAQLHAALEATAADLGTPGKDNLYGAGRLALRDAPPWPPSAPANTSLPAIAGIAQQGQRLTAAEGIWDSPPLLYSYQWQRCATAGACVDITAARDQGYTAQAADVGSMLRVEVTAVNTGGASTASSPPTPPVKPLAPINTSPPALAGTASFGATLTASNGSWSSNGQITYATVWERCDAGGAGCAPAGATGGSYILGVADVGATVRAVVTAANAGGSTSAASAASAVVAPPAPVNVSAPTLTGVARAGETLVATTGAWSYATHFAYRWLRCRDSSCVDVDGASGARYVLGGADVGTSLRVVVTATNSSGSTPASSPPTARVAPRRLSGLAASAVRRSRALAGARFSASMKVTRRETGRPAAGRLTCAARVGATRLAVTRKSFSAGTATCTWRVPRAAAGKRLLGRLRVTTAYGSVERRFSVPVRRG
ncbi:MAG: S8 family serine peptidase, partial [Thermoleophilia bacterium]|nr:S8 family serine peptidase [Thermoleophilia bacterium]